jgi:hypothetical protein
LEAADEAVGDVEDGWDGLGALGEAAGEDAARGFRGLFARPNSGIS